MNTRLILALIGVAAVQSATVDPYGYVYGLNNTGNAYGNAYGNALLLADDNSTATANTTAANATVADVKPCAKKDFD